MADHGGCLLPGSNSVNNPRDVRCSQCFHGYAQLVTHVFTATSSEDGFNTQS